MPGVGGPIDNVSINGRGFSIAQDSESNTQLGGDNNDVEMNGDFTGRLIKSVVPWMIDGLAFSIDNQTDDQQFIQNFVDGQSFGTLTVAYASGAIYQGEGQITGEIASSSKSATAPLTLKGPGKFTKQ